MSDPKYPPPGGFPPPNNSTPKYPPPEGYSQPGGGFPPPDNYSYPPPSGYGFGQPQQQVYASSFENTAGLRAATFGIRLTALILDGIIAGIAWSIIRGIMPGSVASFISWSVIYAAYAVLTSLYFQGATVGKMLLGLRVVDRNGNVPELVPLILRYTIGYWLSWFIAGLGFLLAAFDPRQQALHDKIAHTYVVMHSRAGRGSRY